MSAFDPPLCVCGHGPHTDRKCDKCGHPEFVRTDVSIARSLTAVVKILDIVGSAWLTASKTTGIIPVQEDSQEEDADPNLPPNPPPPPNNLTPFMPQPRTAVPEEEANHGTETDTTPDQP